MNLYKHIYLVLVFIFVFCIAQGQTQQNTSAAGTHAVLVEQVGYYNKVVSNTRATNSIFTMYQKGVSNNITLVNSHIDTRGWIAQYGYSNSVSAYGVGNGPAVIQKGANQHLLTVGANSISERMGIIMKGNKQNVIVRNFKRKR